MVRIADFQSANRGSIPLMGTNNMPSKYGVCNHGLVCAEQLKHTSLKGLVEMTNDLNKVTCPDCILFLNRIMASFCFEYEPSCEKIIHLWVKRDMPNE